VPRVPGNEWVIDPNAGLFGTLRSSGRSFRDRVLDGVYSGMVRGKRLTDVACESSQPSVIKVLFGEVGLLRVISRVGERKVALKKVGNDSQEQRGLSNLS